MKAGRKQTYTDWVFPFKVRSESKMTPEEWAKIKDFIYLITPLKDYYPSLEFHVDKGGPTDHFPESSKERKSKKK